MSLDTKTGMPKGFYLPALEFRRDARDEGYGFPKDGELTPRQAEDWFFRFDDSFGVITFALALLNCKNVHAREQPCPPKLAKRYEERHGHKRPRYYVLDIEPMRQKFRDANGGRDGISLAKALHICRGHFKNYDERPMFGKLKGTYWWQPHVRGTAEAGVVDKDYRIKLPNGGG